MGVRLRLGDPGLAESLSGFLRRCDCAVEQVGDMLAVSPPHELHEQQARLELNVYLRVWQSLRDWTLVEYVDDPVP